MKTKQTITDKWITQWCQDFVDPNSTHKLNWFQRTWIKITRGIKISYF